VETGTSTGMFSGRVVLTGYKLDTNADGAFDTNPKTGLVSPGSGLLETSPGDSISVVFQFNAKSYSASSKIEHNLGEIIFTGSKDSDSISVRVIDADMNINRDSVDVVFAQLSSDDDPVGIKLKLKETGKSSGLFDGMVTFTADKSSGDKLKANAGLFRLYTSLLTFGK
jgi:hypothetical protein